jgi:hypothetical protein
LRRSQTISILWSGIFKTRKRYQETGDCATKEKEPYYGQIAKTAATISSRYLRDRIKGAKLAALPKD